MARGKPVSGYRRAPVTAGNGAGKGKRRGGPIPAYRMSTRRYIYAAGRRGRSAPAYSGGCIAALAIPAAVLAAYAARAARDQD